MSRIDFDAPMIKNLAAMAEGNPGAITALISMMEVAPVVDPDSIWAELTPVMDLDNAGIYGSKIWIFYKDICGENPKNCLTFLRSIQLGYTPLVELQEAVNSPRYVNTKFDFTLMREEIQTFLPNFGRS